MAENGDDAQHDAATASSQEAAAAPAEVAEEQLTQPALTTPTTAKAAPAAAEGDVESASTEGVIERIEQSAATSRTAEDDLAKQTSALSVGDEPTAPAPVSAASAGPSEELEAEQAAASGANSESGKQAQESKRDASHSADEEKREEPAQAKPAADQTSLQADGSKESAPRKSESNGDVSTSYEAVAQAFGRSVSSQGNSRTGSPAPQQADASTISIAEDQGGPQRSASIPTNAAAEEAPFDFSRFLEQMKLRSAAPVGEYVRR